MMTSCTGQWLTARPAALPRAPEAATVPDNADLAAVVDQLERTIAEADPKQAKALLRLLIKELRVNGRSEILPTYRIITPEVCALPSSVGLTGQLSNPPANPEGALADAVNRFRVAEPHRVRARRLRRT
jgi:hypothetical protein